jgi:RHS repeat-associated protein
MSAGTADDLDYMHARYYHPQLGRFLAVDPALESAELLRPQSWNRYNYAYNSPLLLTDPNGENPLVLFVLAGIVGGLLFGPEAANAPESFDADLVPSSDGMRAVVASSVTIASVMAVARSSGGNDEAPGGKPLDESAPVDPNVRGLERQLREHEEKLEAYKEDPDAADNLGFLRNAGEDEERRRRIVEGRIKNLERQIENFRKQIERRLKKE